MQNVIGNLIHVHGPLGSTPWPPVIRLINTLCENLFNFCINKRVQDVIFPLKFRGRRKLTSAKSPKFPATSEPYTGRFFPKKKNENRKTIFSKNHVRPRNGNCDDLQSRSEIALRARTCFPLFRCAEKRWIFGRGISRFLLSMRENLKLRLGKYERFSMWYVTCLWRAEKIEMDFRATAERFALRWNIRLLQDSVTWNWQTKSKSCYVDDDGRLI